LLMLILTFGSAYAITLFPFVIYQNKYKKMNIITRNHEMIHIAQQMECAAVGLLIYLTVAILSGLWLWTLFILPLFYYLYFINWIINLFIYPRYYAYRLISFEREAYNKANINAYYKLRRPFAWIKYIIFTKNFYEKK